MLHKVTCRALALAASGCLLVTDASALVVGRARGAVLLGRPLELTIPVTLDAPGDDPACASADVFHGEEQVRRAPTVRWEPRAGGEGVLRVLSAVPVDEPMVTLYLRIGCGGQAVTRRFVLLSEVPPESEPARPATRVAPPAVLAPLVQPPVVPAPGRPSQAGAEGAAAAPVGPRRRQPAPADAAMAALRAERALPAQRVAVREADPPPRARRPERAPARPRLTLEPLDLAPERDPVLRLSSELRTDGAADPQKRAAAAALWQALQKGPDEALQDAQRLQSLERELKSLRESVQQNAATVAQMRAQVEKAHSERGLAATLVGLLSLVLLGLGGWLGWRWYSEVRMRRVGRWFEQHGDSALGPLVPPAAAPAAVMPDTAPAAMAPAGGPAAAAAVAGAATAAAARAPAPVAPREEFQASRGGSMRMVGVEELIDVHDKADFFLSIGETDQAIAVLEAHVHDQVETSALAWMDLLELYHSLGRRNEYERLRNEFRQRFTAQVPDFEHFGQRGDSLEDYGRAVSRIVALWPSRRVLDVIEESIFRKPGLAGAEPFGLEAYRELVLLYHVARDLAQHEDQARGGRPAGFRDTTLHPLNMPERTEQAERELLLIPPASSRLGVDIDIGELAPQEPARELPALDFDLDLDDIGPREDAGEKRG